MESMDLQLLQVPMRQWTFWLRPGQTMWLFLSNMMMTKRFSIFQNCVITTAYFGAGTWLNIGSKDWAAFAHGIMMLLRRLLAADVDREALLLLERRQVCAYVGYPSPRDVLRLCRLTYYRSVLAYGPDALWALIALEGSWHCCVQEDLIWWHALIDPTIPRPCPAADLAFWTSLGVQPGVWKGLLKKASKKLLMKLTIEVEVDIWASHLLEMLREADLPIHRGACSAGRGAPTVHGCLLCKKLFATKSAWAAYCFRKHGRRLSRDLLLMGTFVMFSARPTSTQIASADTCTTSLIA